jgi:hypothetical protein
MAPRYELAVGLRKGHRTTKIRIGKTKQDKKHTIRPSRLKGVGLKQNVFLCTDDNVSWLWYGFILMNCWFILV